MPLTTATWDSVNVIFAQLDLDVGPRNVTKTAHDMGIEAPLESVPAEAIGGLRYGVTPLEMADAYATLASGGIHHSPTAIDRVEFPDGEVDQADNQAGDRVLTEGQAYEVTKILEGVITSGTGAGYTYMGCTGEAGKTGTSEGLSDAWFAGYTPLYSTAVWVGHPQSREETGFGGPTAGPIWRSFMESAAGGNCPEFEEPSSLPELSGLSSEHTRSSSESAPQTETSEEPEESEPSKKGEGKEKEAEEGGGNEPAPPPTPAPTPSAPRPPRHRRHRKASAAASPRRPASPLLADQLDAVPVRVADEGDPVALGAPARAVGRLLGLDAVAGEPLEGSVEVVDGEGDVVVAGAVLVLGDAVVVGELQDRVLAGQVHEDVDRLVADRHPPGLLEAELLVEGDRPIDVAYPVTGVEESRHARRKPSAAPLTTGFRVNNVPGSKSTHRCRGEAPEKRR